MNRSKGNSSGPPGSITDFDLTDEVTPSVAIEDSAHTGDIIGALGTIREGEQRGRRNRWHRILTLLAIMGPGLVVMVGDNDAGGVATYAQAGQTYGPNLLWTLLLLVPVLYINQEMVVRLGAVTGVGHGRLIFARFGKFWGAFSVIDLFILNTLTIVTEFIGVDQAFGYFGIPTVIAIPVAALLLFLFASGGSFRRWERWMYGLIAINLAVIPMALLTHPHWGQIVTNSFIPNFPGGLSAPLLLLIISIVGTTVAPWQLFFQQSNVVDKRITPKWISFERVDTAVGIVITEIGAAAIMCATAFGLFHTHAFGNYSNAQATALSLRTNSGSAVGTLFAIVLLDASLIGASAVTLSTTYALGDVFKVRHSLHWSPRRAPAFYIFYAALLVVSAAVVLIPHAPLGLITEGVQALAGVLLPSATVFLVILCNDREVLGPWVNTTAWNVAAGAIVWVLVLLSLTLTATTLFPHLSGGSLVLGIGLGATIGVAGGAVFIIRPYVRKKKDTSSIIDLTELEGDRISGLNAKSIPRKDRLNKGKDKLSLEYKLNWRTPPLDTLAKPQTSLLRNIGLAILRAYLLIAVVLIAVKIIQLAVGHG